MKLLKLCPVCGKKHREEIENNKLLTKDIHEDTITGYSLCPDCTKPDYLCFVAVVKLSKKDSISPHWKNLELTGDVFYMKSEQAKDVFMGATLSGLNFIDHKSYKRIKSISNILKDKK